MNALAPIGFATAYRQLAPTEREFVDAYVHMAETAARKSGESPVKLLQQPVTVEMVEASRGLLARPMVIAAIGERINDIAQTHDVTMNMVIKELRAIAFSSIDHVTNGYDMNGHPIINFEIATPEQRSAIASFEQEFKTRGGSSIKYKLYDKLAALRMLIELLGADGAKPPASSSAMPAPATVEGIADRYARMIADG